MMKESEGSVTEKNISDLRKKIIEIGKLLWNKGLVSGLSGNISLRVNEEQILITATKTCLGLLEENDVLIIDLMEGKDPEGRSSTETLLHTALYKNFMEAQAVIHTHTPFINGYFLENTSFASRIIEAKITLGKVSSVDQSTPSVTDVAPVLAMMAQNNIGVLRNHGVLAMGNTLFDCFLGIQSLEEAIKVECVRRLCAPQGRSADKPGASTDATAGSPGRAGPKAEAADTKYRLFSPEQMEAIVEVVNEDAVLHELGTKTDMTMDLAVKMEETGEIFSFHFDKGRIKEMGKDEEAEFLITAPEDIWRAVFKRELDPFVATTQKKMHLRGDFGRISKWYAPCSRIFEIWTKVPVA